jgi:multidrug resistance efflux pump
MTVAPDQFRRRRIRRVSVGVISLLLIAFIVHETLQPPATQARARDVQNAQRVLAARDGTPDFRSAVPAAAGTHYIAGQGRVEPAGGESRISAEVPGLIRDILVQEGARVNPGDPLIQLDSAAEQAAVDAARADLASEKAALRQALAGPRQQERAAAAAEAKAAEAKALLSAATLHRLEPLAPTGAATPQELDRARAEANADAASARAAEARARLLAAGSRPEEIALAQAHVDAGAARLAQAEAALSLRTVRAPLVATVLSIPARAGEYFTPQAAGGLVILGDTRKLRVRMEVDERQIHGVHPHARAWVTADAFGDRSFQGTVVDIGRRIGRKLIHTDLPGDRADADILELLIDLDEPGPLLPGQRVTAYVEETPPRS